MRAVRATRLLAVVAVLAAAARLLRVAADHARPAQWAEAADLQRMMFYHWGLRDHLGWGWWDQVARDGFKPPLWYGGVPLLGAGRPTLDAGFVAWTAAALLLVLVALVWRGTASVGRDRTIAGPVAALLLVVLPGVAGRFPVAGVEPLHAVLLLGWVLVLRRLREPGLGAVAGAGALLGAGLLAKWTFGAYALGPWLFEVVAARRDRRRLGRLVGAGLLGAAVFSPWLLVADPAAILAGVGDEPTLARDPEGALLYYPRALAGALGVPGLAVLAGVAAGLRFGPAHGPRPARADVGLLVAAIGSLLVVHALVPHKEARYLLPVLPLIVVLGVAPLGSLLRPRDLATVATAVVLPLVASAGLLFSAGGVFFAEELRLLPDPDDRGLDALVRHPSFAERPRSVVAYAVPEPSAPMKTTIDWAFYSGNAAPVLGRRNHADLTERSAAFDLERATHVVTGRELNDQERAALSSLGFRREVEGASIDLQGFAVLSLWVLEPGRTPPKRGPGPAPPTTGR